MKNEEKVLEKLGDIVYTVDRIERRIKDEQTIKMDVSVQHSLLWGSVVLGIALIVLWAIRITH